MMQAASAILTWCIAAIAIPGLLASKSGGGILPRSRGNMLKRDCKLLVIGLLASSSIAHASATLPPFVDKTKFKSHADCVASLRNDLQQDRDATTNGWIGFRDGMTRRVTLITDGLVTQSRNVTIYRSELWRGFAGPVDRPGAPETEAASGAINGSQTRTSAKYEKRLSVCKGRIKTVTGEEGYTMDTFE